MKPISTRMKHCAIFVTLWAFAAMPASAQTYNFTTLAGTPYAGHADGLGPAAAFNLPLAVAVDSGGTVYVADHGNHVIRTITPAGLVSTLAGVPGQRGSTDGVGASARFSFPRSITVDRLGNVYVVDNATIRKIAPGGVVNTLAGQPGATGSRDGPGSVARFSFGSDRDGGVAADQEGNLYVADTGNNIVRKISPEGLVSTFAGTAGQRGDADGTGAAARFDHPARVTVDGAGTVFVSDYRDPTIFGEAAPLGSVRRINSSGVVTTLARTVTATRGIAVDHAGNVYVTNSYDATGNGYNTISRITPSGVITPFAGASGDNPVPRDGTGNSAAFLYPEGLTIDEIGNLFVADTRNHAIRRVTPTGEVTTFAGSLPVTRDGGRDDARFQLFQGAQPLAVDAAGFVYLADDSTIRKIAPDGRVSTLAGLAGQAGTADGTGSAARFSRTGFLAVDRTGNVFASEFSGSLRRISPAGVVTTIGDASLRVGNLALDSAGTVFFTSVGSTLALKKVTSGGGVSVVAGDERSAGYMEGIGTAARFAGIAGLAIDSRDNIFVSDQGNAVIRKISPDGVVTTFAGQRDMRPIPERRIVDGSTAEARFVFPGRIAVDGAGNVFVNDFGVLRKISNGIVTTSFAAPMSPNTSFAWAMDRTGSIYTTDGQTVIKGVELSPGDRQSRLSNASILANLDRQRPLIIGFNLQDSAQAVLLRAVGPGLREFAPGMVVASDPRIDAFATNGATTGSNEDWGGGALLAAAFRSVGAFPLDAGSTDAALLQTASGPNTVHVSSANAGTGLVELFDLGANVTSGIANVSARHNIGDASITLGFTVDGAVGKTVLIRGIGPALAAAPFNVSPALSRGVLAVYNASGERLAQRFDYTAIVLPVISARVGAFPVSEQSSNPAIVMTLQPGGYTAVLSAGLNATPGEAMIEIYEVR